jgi:uncharacterized membrane protein (UPF0127 family)
MTARRFGMGLVAALAAALGLVSVSAEAACNPARIELRGPWGQAAFGVEIADTDAARARGLMHRDSLPRSAGMLFVYPRPVRAQFWMKDTLIPLDMIFADEAGRVQGVHHRARPLDTTVIDGGPGIRFVLEINGGLAERMGIAAGSELRHPAIDGPDAAWPCR